MPKLPLIKPKELVKVLKRLGFVEIRQKGSHLIMFSIGKNKTAVIPIHNKPLRRGTLKSILEQADIEARDLSK